MADDPESSPSAGWRGVYAAMGVSTAADGGGDSAGAGAYAGAGSAATADAADRRADGRLDAADADRDPASGSGEAGVDADGDRRCPTCGGPGRSLGRGRFRCPDHGAWRAGASATG